MAIEYFCCYHSYVKKCEKLTDQELGRLFRALMTYSSTGERQELAGRESIAFDFIAEDIDRAKEAYAEKCRKNAANGAAGAKKRWLEKVSENSERYKTDSENSERHFSIAKDSENSQNKDKEKNKDKDKKETLSFESAKKKRFKPPTAEEVAEYCRERGNAVDPEMFVNFYAAKGWKIGKNSMQDWKAAVRTWERKDREDNAAALQQKAEAAAKQAKMDAWIRGEID